MKNRKRTIVIGIIMLLIFITGQTAFAAETVSAGILDTQEMFTERDLLQTPDLTDAQTMTVTDDGEIHITEEGVYVLTGTVSHAIVYVEADSQAKVQLVLDDLHMTNSSFPCIYIVSADKVFVTTLTDSELTVTDAFVADEDVNTDGVIFARSDLVLNGTGTLTVASSETGIVCKDDLKITGGTYSVQAGSKAIEANDSIAVAGGILNLYAGTDGLHAENDEDDSLGYIYISGGEINIQAGDDGIHTISAFQLDGGTLNITAGEGIEGTYLQLNGGEVTIQSSDDGINAANKSASWTTVFEMNDGSLTIVTGAGDTDAVDSNGAIYINGGTLDITGSSAFDCDGTTAYNGGTIIVNGQQVDSIPLQQMNGGSFGGRGR